MSLFAQTYSGMSDIDKVGMNSFPDPFCDIASTQMPTSINDVLRWAEYVWINQGVYKAAMERVCAYFLTNIELSEISNEQKESYMDFMNNKLGIINKLRILGLDFLCYGNSFSSIYIPFARHLICPTCKLDRPISKVDYKFESFEFHGYCPKCKKRVKFIRKDRKITDENQIKIIRWNPHQIKLQFHPFNHNVEYLWKIPRELSNWVLRGVPFYVEQTPWEIIEAIKDNKLFRFSKDVVYHMKEETLAGIDNKGWGIPRSLSHFKQTWYIQVLKRFNEAIALDYIIPFRVITPKAGNSNAMDPLIHSNLASFSGEVRSMLNQRRYDPAMWNILPFPIEYAAYGGEGTQLAPVELLNQASEELLNSAGCPVDFFRGNLQTQAAPMALRLFEQTWPHFVAACNGWISWFLETMHHSFNWDAAQGKLKSVRLADDLERRQILLQLSASNVISKGSAFASWGLDLKDEIREMFNEQRVMQEEQDKFQREQEQAQSISQQLAATQGGGGPQGMMPGAPPMNMMGAPNPMAGPGATISVQDMMGQADQIAQQLLTMPYEMRRQQMVAIKKQNPALHSLVKVRLEDARGQISSQAKQQVSMGGMMQQQPPPM